MAKENSQQICERLRKKTQTLFSEYFSSEDENFLALRTKEKESEMDEVKMLWNMTHMSFVIIVVLHARQANLCFSSATCHKPYFNVHPRHRGATTNAILALDAFSWNILTLFSSLKSKDRDFPNVLYGCMTNQ